MTREKIDVHHHCAVIHLSTSLMMVKGLSAIFAKHPTMTAEVSYERMYQVDGKY